MTYNNIEFSMGNLQNNSTATLRKEADLLFISGNYKDALNQYMILGENEYNDPAAQWRAGKCYYHGWGIPLDKNTAIKWFQKAASQNYCEANYILSTMYLSGINVEKNEQKAFNILSDLIEKYEFKGALYTLGFMYLKGQYVQQNVNLGFDLLKKAAEKGHRFAMLKISECYANGLGTVSSDVLSNEWKIKAAQNKLDNPLDIFIDKLKNEDNKSVNFFENLPDYMESSSENYFV